MKKLAFLSDGEMMVLEDGRVRELSSGRKEAYIRTARNLEERNAWKYEGAGAQFQMHGMNPYERTARIAEESCRVTALALWEDQLLYALVTPDMGGLYLKDLAAEDALESSWLSEREFRPTDLHIRDRQIALALDSPRGERHIALMTAGKPRYEIITQGDTQDSAPFLTGDGYLLYASAGWARNEDGMPIARGPSEVLRLNLRTGSLDVLLSDEAHDYLRPKEGPDGALYAIRRPYKAEGPRRLSLPERLKNIGAAFKGLGRLLKAIGDPEGTAKRTPRVAGQSTQAVQQRMLEGILVDIARPGGTEEEPILKDWTLLRKPRAGDWEELLHGVADYDFDGSALIYSDGRRILRMEDGKKTVLHKGVFIPRVIAQETEGDEKHE